MICYKDKTFCSASEIFCGNQSCHRYFGPEQREGANRWWKTFMDNKKAPIGPPIAMSDFSVDCPYQTDL